MPQVREGVMRRNLNVNRFTFLVVAVAALLQAGVQPAAAQTDALQFFKNYFVTGDYVVGGVVLRGTGASGGQIEISGVPDGADIQAAFLYWQVMTKESDGPDSVSVPVWFNGHKLALNGAPLGKLLGNGTPPCWSSGGTTGSGGAKRTYTFRADVLRFLDIDEDPLSPGYGKYKVNGPHPVVVPDSGGGGNTTPVALGASLVVVYRDYANPKPDTPTPLSAIVIYDGAYNLGNSTRRKDQTIQGFYQPDGAPVAKLTHIVGSGQGNKTETVNLNGIAIGQDVFDRDWVNYTVDVADVAKYLGTSPSDLRAVTTSVYPSDDCLTWGAVIFKTSVLDTDRDGLLNIWESSNPPLMDPNGKTLPNLQRMGADENVPDLFVEVGYMYTKGDTAYGSVYKADFDSLDLNPKDNKVSLDEWRRGASEFDRLDQDDDGFLTWTEYAKSNTRPQHSHLPAAAALAQVGKAFAVPTTDWPNGVRVHFDIGTPPAGWDPDGLASPYIIQGADLARGGESLEETDGYVTSDGTQYFNLCTRAATDPVWSCQFGKQPRQPTPEDPSTLTPGYPGTVGWKTGFRYIRDLVLQDPYNWNGVGQDPCDAPGNSCEKLFDENRQQMFRFGLFAHAPGLPKSSLPCLDAAGQPAEANTSQLCAAPLTDNPAFHEPRTNTGVGDFPGGDFMVTLGGFRDTNGLSVGTPFMQASTIMHELGHGFELAHGGLIGQPNCKPVHLSVMNYLYQLRGLLDDSGKPHLNYSFGKNDASDENDLNDGSQGTFDYRLGWYAPYADSYLFGRATPARAHCDGTGLLDSDVPMVRVDARSSETNPALGGTESIGMPTARSTADSRSTSTSTVARRRRCQGIRSRISMIGTTSA
jgi:hypothetical protein